jgi:hypothetical protein
MTVAVGTWNLLEDRDVATPVIKAGRDLLLFTC